MENNIATPVKYKLRKLFFHIFLELFLQTLSKSMDKRGRCHNFCSSLNDVYRVFEGRSTNIFDSVFCCATGVNMALHAPISNR